MREEIIKKIRETNDYDDLLELKEEIWDQIKADSETKVLFPQTQDEYNSLKKDNPEEYVFTNFERNIAPATGITIYVYFNSKYAGFSDEVLKRKKELR